MLRYRVYVDEQGEWAYRFDVEAESAHAAVGEALQRVDAADVSKEMKLVRVSESSLGSGIASARRRMG